MIKKYCFLIFILIVNQARSFPQSSHMELDAQYLLIFQNYIKSFHKNIKLEVTNNVDSIQHFPINYSFPDKRIVYFQKENYFIGILYNFFEPNEMFLKNHNQFIIAFDAKQNLFFWFYNNLHEIQFKTDSIVVEDLISTRFEAWIIDKYRKPLRNIYPNFIQYKAGQSEGRHILQVVDYKDFKKSGECFIHGFKIDTSITKDNLIYNSIGSFCKILSVFSKDYDPEKKNKWHYEKKCKLDYYTRSLIKYPNFPR